MKNYYQVLNLEPNCSMEEIKSAYKKYAQEFHPDKHNGSPFFEERFLKIKEAYDKLSSYQERRIHDDYHSFNQNSQASKPNEHQNNDNSKEFNENIHQETKSGNSNQQSNAERPTFDHYVDWAQKKYNSGDFYGAMQELDKAQKLEPANGFINFIKANLYENSNDLLSAKRLYKKSFSMNYLKANDDLIRLEALKNDAKRIYTPYLFYAQLGVVVSFILYFILRTGMPAIQAGLIAELIGVITGTVIARLVFKKVPKPVLNLLNTDWELQFMLLICITALIGGFPFIMYVINSR